jgi:LacI family transcriptional regulator
MQWFSGARQKSPAVARLVRGIAWCCLLAFTGLVPAFAQGPEGVKVDGSSVTIKSVERPLMVYRYVENPAKPYLSMLYSPGGVNVLRDSPADHKHHHGLMFAVAVDGVDFWSENPNCGRQINRSKEAAKIVPQHGDALAFGPQQIDWVGPGGAKLVLRETRRVAVRRVPQSNATLVTWRTRLEPPPGKDSVTLTGSTYFGLGMRFVRSMDTGGHFVNADGKTGVAGTNNARSAWCAYSASAEGKPVTVAVFDSPTNPRHPATWFTMDSAFAYVSATLDLSRQPLAIRSGKPLELCYRVAVWDDKVDAATIAALYREATTWDPRLVPQKE